MSCGFFADYPTLASVGLTGRIHLVQKILCFIRLVSTLPRNVNPWETPSSASRHDSEINRKRVKLQALGAAPLQAGQNSSEQRWQVSSKATRASTFRGSSPCDWDISSFLHIFSGRDSCPDEGYFQCSDPGSD